MNTLLIGLGLAALCAAKPLDHHETTFVGEATDRTVAWNAVLSNKEDPVTKQNLETFSGLITNALTTGGLKGQATALAFREAQIGGEGSYARVAFSADVEGTPTAEEVVAAIVKGATELGYDWNDPVVAAADNRPQYSIFEYFGRATDVTVQFADSLTDSTADAVQDTLRTFDTYIQDSLNAGGLYGNATAFRFTKGTTDSGDFARVVFRVWVFALGDKPEVSAVAEAIVKGATAKGFKWVDPVLVDLDAALAPEDAVSFTGMATDRDVEWNEVLADKENPVTQQNLKAFSGFVTKSLFVGGLDGVATAWSFKEASIGGEGSYARVSFSAAVAPQEGGGPTAETVGAAIVGGSADLGFDWNEPSVENGSE